MCSFLVVSRLFDRLSGDDTDLVEVGVTGVIVMGSFPLLLTGVLVSGTALVEGPVFK